MIVVDGTIAGSWKRTINGSKVTVELRVNRLLTERQRERVIETNERCSQFIGRTVQIKQ